MVVGLLTVELHVPGSQSLKDKRMVLRRVKDRLKKFNVAVSEVDHHDLWQRAALAVVTVSTDQAHAELIWFWSILGLDIGVTSRNEAGGKTA